ncbi:hypothetical protein KP509_16G044200 [Ceratopteris richardii]|uniref:Uncharacterized protein n=1 Tax=Ceratopteris richardii TaxID=49495 RepID=A0A8T2T1K8_CERRI|nr:hypothetical protein KP509_16G044200 [Ceratopteris richardii]
MAGSESVALCSRSTGQPDETPAHNSAKPWTSCMMPVCMHTGDGKKQHLTSASRQTTSSVTLSRSILLCRKLAAEFVGTFLLILTAEGSAIMNELTKGALTYIGVGLAPGLAVTIIILSTGHISGAHLNPSATLAFAIIKHHPWVEVPLYMVTQLVASILASAALKGILQYDGAAGLTLPSKGSLQATIVETIITFLMMFVATALSVDKCAVKFLVGPAVGASVFLNNIIAGALTGASMNPVRTLGPAIVFNNYRMVWVYIVGPTIGAILGSVTYILLRVDNENSCEQLGAESNKNHEEKVG